MNGPPGIDTCEMRGAGGEAGVGLMVRSVPASLAQPLTARNAAAILVGR
jgi:hypothetical protein